MPRQASICANKNIVSLLQCLAHIATAHNHTNGTFAGHNWDTSGGISTASNVASVITNAPTKTKFMIVSNPDRHVICFGTETTIGTLATQDPMFIRWSTRDNETDWTPSATNTAGSQRIVGGSKIVTAVRTRGQILVLTDTSAHGMSFIGAPFVFGFQQLGSNCGAISPHCAIDVGGVSYWMSSE